MKYYDKVIKYVDDIWLDIQRNKSEYANAETYAEASRIYTHKAFFKTSRLSNRISACVHILENDFRQDLQAYRAKLVCAIIYNKYDCDKYKNFVRHAFPVMTKDFWAFKDFSAKVYDVNVEMEVLTQDAVHNRGN